VMDKSAPLDLARVLAASLFVAVLVAAAALWVTFGPLAGALGLLAPFAVWYAALTKQRADREAHERAMAVSAAREARTLTRPSAPTRTPLDEGGSVGPAQWRPAGGE
jgi:hypothetical protein